jgi:hypothetical protein
MSDFRVTLHRLPGPTPARRPARGKPSTPDEDLAAPGSRGGCSPRAAGAAAGCPRPPPAPAISLPRDGVIGYKQGFREIGYSVTRH